MAEAQAYLDEIAQLTREPSSEKRRELLIAVTDVFLVTVNQQDDVDSLVFGEVMERIAYELEAEARAQLADRLCDTDRAPRGLIVRLANDEIDVARPVLENSPVLEDSDLIEVIRNASEDHRRSIAGRASLSELVSGELVERGDENTMARLTGNEGASLSRQSIEKIAVRADGNPGLLQALDARGDVPADILERIKSTVSDRMKSELTESHPEIDEKFVEALVERCAEGVDLDYCQESVAEIDRIHREEGIKEDRVARYARERRVADVVHSLALATGLDDWSVAQCLLNAELPALMILCKANRFSGPTFLALVATRSGEGNLKSSALAKTMRDYDALGVATAERIMRFLHVRLKMKRERQTGAPPPE